MKHFIIIIVLLFSGLLCFAYFNNLDETNNKTHFTIFPNDSKLVFPVKVNDSITANLSFDTGGAFLLDSTFCAAHPSITNKMPFTKDRSGSAWTSKSASTLFSNLSPDLALGNVKLAKFDRVRIMDYKNYWGDSNSQGLFNIPENDNSNIWELNFEDNYIEIHSSDNFQIPSDCFVVPLINDRQNYDRFTITLSFKVTCADGDTTTIKRNFLIDTGADWDVMFVHGKGELPFFNNRKDANWVAYLYSYYRYYTVNATVFDNQFSLDSLRIHSLEDTKRRSNIIGLNFLKRFNVFLDLKNKKVGFQPIKNFKRIKSPMAKRFHFSMNDSKLGGYIVTDIVPNNDNFYYKAGLRNGDRIISINKKTSRIDILKECRQADVLNVKVIRNKKILGIIVPVDKNEIQPN